MLCPKNKSYTVTFILVPSVPSPDETRTFVKDKSITFVWHPSVKFNGELLTYEAVVKLEDKPVESQNTTNLSCTFSTNLKFSTTYEIAVRAFTRPTLEGNGGGASQFSNSIQKTTENPRTFIHSQVKDNRKGDLISL